MNDLHAILYLAVMAEHLVGPETKACQIGGDTRNLEGNSLKGRIAPRLIIGRIDTEVVAQDDIIVSHIDNAILAVKVARQENDLDMIVLAVVHVVVLHHAQHIIMAHVVKPVRDLRHVQRRVESLLAGQTLLKVLTGFAHPARHFDEGQYLLLQVAVAQQAVHGFDKDVDALVAELVAATGRDYQRVVVELLTQQGIGHLKQALAGSLALTGKLCTLGHETVVETIGQHDVDRLVKQFDTLTRRDVTDGRKTVNMMGGLFLNGVLRLHVQLTCHLVAVIGKEVVVEGFLIAGYRTSDTGGMGREDGTNLWQLVVDIQGTESTHPLIGVIDDAGFIGER